MTREEVENLRRGDVIRERHKHGAAREVISVEPPYVETASFDGAGRNSRISFTTLRRFDFIRPGNRT